MPTRVAVTVETLVATAVAVLQVALVTGAGNTDSIFACDDPDEAAELGAVQQDQAVAVWLRQFDQPDGDVTTDAPTNEISWAVGELVVSVFVRVDLDQIGRGTTALADQTNGAARLVRRVAAALNEVDPTAAGNYVLAAPATFNREQYRGRVKVKGLERWRRYDVAFGVQFAWSLA